MEIESIKFYFQPQVGQLYLFLGEDGEDDQDHADAILNLDENSSLTSDEVTFDIKYSHIVLSNNF